MKKIICTLLALMLVLAMTVPAYAVTPDLEVPDMPEIPDISDDVVIELPEGIFDDYLPDIDIEVELPEEEPTEPPAQTTYRPPDWRGVWKGWLSWLADKFRWG